MIKLYYSPFLTPSFCHVSPSKNSLNDHRQFFVVCIVVDVYYQSSSAPSIPTFNSSNNAPSTPYPQTLALRAPTCLTASHEYNRACIHLDTSFYYNLVLHHFDSGDSRFNQPIKCRVSSPLSVSRPAMLPLRLRRVTTAIMICNQRKTPGFRRGFVLPSQG